MELKHQLGLVCMILLLPALCSAYFTKSRATFYSAPGGYGTSTGACGYGNYGSTVYGGKVAGVSGLWRDGNGCGACYQVRCTDSQLCDPNGVTLVATDQGYGDRTDFVMSLLAFSSLGRDQAATDQLKKYGTVDIEYQRVSCNFAGNIVFKVQKSSSNPGYFSGVPINVAGKCDIHGIDLKAQGTGWIAMRRNTGAVFDLQNPPSGPYTLRFQLKCDSGLTYVVAKNPIPGNWIAGGEYNLGVQL